MTTRCGAVIAPLGAAGLEAVLALLGRVRLPGDGLEEHQDTVLVARLKGRLVGCAALELYGGSALLRSVAVDADLRGQGLGVDLTRAAVDLARRHGAKRVYLLTETAGDFFPRFGFRSIPRSAAAPEVQRSVEFTTVCPETAEVMLLELPAAGP